MSFSGDSDARFCADTPERHLVLQTRFTDYVSQVLDLFRSTRWGYA